ncbi:rhomboid family intramembrane serine protease [Acinetobacter sp. ANC 4648]|uniref:rhomboid family intramembrane serine protease n=1 Tax=Acinetobacter sp. ANC 4648 TaxID=1977875 RepID=UPI000A34653A|nr:rhomboid family intramembrane serine protease [Acinetobacter sp. ANC 4648]OTG83777.1 rhomboid family intramembrane serine protease [Acinetobacter sp. ANC 4648]
MSDYQHTPTFVQTQNMSGKITLLLIAINVGLFTWQILTGVNITDPSTADALRWGADYAPLTFLEEPFRLFSSMFFHFGLMHLMFNMWALYVFGNVAEQTLGRIYYLGLYVLAGLMGSLLSGYLDIRHSYELLQNFDPSLIPRVSAGASGAVMGLGGALTVLSLFPPTPNQRFILDQKSLIIVLAINLAFGFFATGINNAAHIGGMLMGALLALTWYVLQRLRQGMLAQIIVLILGALITYAVYLYCQSLVQPITPLWQEAITQMRSQLNL